jgi:putative oxidoreductase
MSLTWPILLATAFRLALSALFLESGVSKLISLPAAHTYLEAVIEIAGALVLLAGYKVRWTAGLLALFSIASAMAFPEGLLKDVALAGGMLYVAMVGEGHPSLDAYRR